MSNISKESIKILTWNINGIRSLKRPLHEVFSSFSSHIICFQETKVTRDQLSERDALIPGYYSFFCFSRSKSGYSGVATYVHEDFCPVKVEEGLSGLLQKNNPKDLIGNYGNHEDFTMEELLALDNEGRTVITEHIYKNDLGDLKRLTIINVYCPRADPENEERKTFKLSFYKLLRIRVEAILNTGSSVIVLGDINTSHKMIDHCDPEDAEEFYSRLDRKWLDGFIGNTILPENSNPLLVDLFRFKHPYRTHAFTCWNTLTGARANNYGTRIDYIAADHIFTKCLTHCDILTEQDGSDHCPVFAEFNVSPNKSTTLPSACTKYFPEFSGKQQTILSYMTKRKLETPVSASKKIKTLSNTETNPKENELSCFHVDTQTPCNFNTESNCPNKNKPKPKNSMNTVWSQMLKGPPAPPNCKGHNIPCVMRTVKKEGCNKGKQFWVCSKPIGHKTNPNSRCEHFEWIIYHKENSQK